MFIPILYKLNILNIDGYQIEMRFDGKGCITYFNIKNHPSDCKNSIYLNDSTSFYWYVEKGILTFGTHDFYRRELKFSHDFDMTKVDVCEIPTFYCDYYRRKVKNVSNKTKIGKCSFGE